MADKRLIDASKLLGVFCADCGMRDGSCSNSCEKDCAIYDTITSAPTVEVQTDDGWISVDDRLPDATYDCLVWYSCDTAFGKSKSWGIAHCSRGDWYTKYLDGDNIVVLYWLPLPEPPEGE